MLSGGDSGDASLCYSVTAPAIVSLSAIFFTGKKSPSGVCDIRGESKYTGWAKNRLFLRSDNFAMTDDRKACNMSKVS